MRLEQLQSLIAVADLKHIGPAAERLFVTPQNISKSIHQLEDELQTVLFTRTKQGMLLTRDGQTAYDMARDILQRTEYLSNAFFTAEMPRMDSEISGRLNLICSASFSSRLYRLQHVFRHRYPKVQVMCAEYDTKHIFEVLNQKTKDSRDTFDMAFLSRVTEKDGFIEKMKELFDVYCLKSEKLGLLMHATDSLANNIGISVKKLENLPIVHFASGTESQLFGENMNKTKVLEEYELDLKATIVTNSFFSWEAYIKDGEGYGIVGSDYRMYRRTEQMENLAFVPFLEDLITRQYLITRKHTALRPEEKMFLEMVKDLHFDTIQQL